MLEKANSIHELLVEQCAKVLSGIGLIPVEDPNTFDLAVVDQQLLVEVKSIHQSNAISQLRKAIAQLPEYRWRHKETFSESTTMVIITNENPALYVDADFLKYLAEDRGIKLFWQQSAFLVDASGKHLEDLLAPLQ